MNVEIANVIGNDKMYVENVDKCGNAERCKLWKWKKKIMLKMLNLGKLMDNRKLRRTFWYLGNLFVGKKWICEDINIWNTINWDNN